MKKTLLMLLLVLAVLTTACGAPAAKPDGGESQKADTIIAAPVPGSDGKISDEKITLRAFQYVLENQQVDFDNMWFYQELEKKTNIHIEWELVKDADWNTKLNLMFASGDWPDMILRGEVDIEEYGVNQGILVPLDDYIEKYMPNYYSRLYLNDAYVSIPASDGKMYYIGNLIAQNVNHESHWFINKTWLDNLGLEIPKTVDELTNVLRAFRDSDPNRNGEKDEIPMSAGGLTNHIQGVYTYFAQFGVPLQYFVYACIDDNQKVVFPGYLPGFRDACEWLHLCYREGLLDPEAITQDSNVWGTKMNAGRVGYTTYLRLINTALTPETAANYVSILPPASKHGVKVPRILEVPTLGAALTVANKHIPETLMWIDAQLETETMMVAYNGPIHEGGPIEPTMKINDQGKYEILYVPENNELYNYVPVYHAQFFAPGDYYFKIYEMPPHRVERYEYSKEYEGAGILEKYSYVYLQRLVKMTNEESIEVSRLYNEIDKFMKESITNFITNGVTDESWQQFLNTAKAVGVDRYVEIYQKAYDNYLAKQ
ncbi:putative ABC-type sugar transport system, periplasmic component [Thermoclostridium stercorarium subsp. stercorarium DSM 8532]|jgi:putative aldouronate transport system substrate-binding protein|uniref:Sugar ABC transporter substrate-binding protein n=3 Tax=Thermoclostridium stercorarium TaxID=1510 RepID=A0A1B1YAF9_THEST|nr:extracellular solute-binding protein [Thermoclostridium stercorarium]AGC67237.1 putative ABC-type sugar transport system, periplasmic component [Thermoclostridium stercorarium subsp. stercorarium DSM 8532]AGI38308.1 ABC transporter permease subunit [Thermoclostridium stercorarium subsp. stercorarium DSM 8532]ANW97745.1 sugar ABC transporter substrate-binding protein [Thermoclostridium stercorarium subsp. thermolacticum DSM 2910]